MDSSYKTKIRYQNLIDGEFWMSYQDFKIYFGNIKFCSISSDFNEGCRKRNKYVCLNFAISTFGLPFVGGPDRVLYDKCLCACAFCLVAITTMVLCAWSQESFASVCAWGTCRVSQSRGMRISIGRQNPNTWI